MLFINLSFLSQHVKYFSSCRWQFWTMRQYLCARPAGESVRLGRADRAGNIRLLGNIAIAGGAARRPRTGSVPRAGRRAVRRNIFNIISIN